ncbi:xanthine dehydrogenase family protein molybdopterin-binding subunit [Leptolyngbya sp. NIES-2104]|uniref:xanthine dehydrogenase family protein molybdopterin-binding subunit n=1 Tax=Leptolyngbya sp. NIES-2104 TaxID=1552121 RepID=UPI0006EC7DAF|nr:xanthine dehydrogenase family protein molybdopterin-binding subunit [Leptolyngbya sp. NIES-2104]GAP96868.1 periplasmic aromatic aldehyde oxidoreductase, molybdenum binding subunit YagR [Leptolyngbya sp. NIES-2104]
MKRRKLIGEATSRVDGISKVTGAANYATDHKIPNLAYAVIFKSEIAAGTISEIDQSAAEQSAGVLAVITHKNAPKLNLKANAPDARPDSSIRGGALLQDNKIEFYGQHIGVVVAETFEQARAAARLVKVSYQKSAAKIEFEKHINEAVVPTGKEFQDDGRGDLNTAFQSAKFKVEAVYETPIEHHHPMAPHATIAVWEAPNKLTLYNEAQVVNGVQRAAAGTLGLPPENVRIVTPHVGGGFGAKGSQWSNLVIAAIAAQAVKRPVKLALSRQQMFNSVGLRQRNHQRLRLAATQDGKLTAIGHDTTTHTATTAEFLEDCGEGAKIMYDSPNSLVTYRVVPMNIILPTFTRGPGQSTGSFALESAMDELAYQLRLDPIEFRLRNEPARDPSNGKPWSSRSVVQCLTRGAEVFGWNRRRLEPRTVRQGNYLIGYGVSSATYPARTRDSSAMVKLTRKAADVRASVELAASDLGTGTYTIIAQTAGELLDLPLEKVTVKIGDSSLPPAAGSVGSFGAASFTNAVYAACGQLRQELQAKSNQQWATPPTLVQLMEAAKLSEYQTRADAKPSPEAEKYSSHSFNANFAEVWVNEATGMVKIPRFVAVTGGGRVLNPKAARSQIIGGVIWGIGMALTEESVIEPRYGNFITRSFADYHVPVNLDIGEIETVFVTEEDKIVNPMGVKGLGEIAICGVAGAVANAIFNATGKRIRNLPITPDKLL